MSDIRKHLIVGAGIAGLNAVKAIRKLNRDDRITMVTMEGHMPYSPAVLPYLISRRTREGNISIADESFFARMDCNLVRKREVVRISPEERFVTYSDGDLDEYDELLIASGSSPARPPIRGLAEAGFIGCHTLGDCRRIMEKLDSPRKILLYGGGLVALEIAAALLEAGHEATIIVRSRILRQYFDDAASELIAAVFRDHRARFECGSEIETVSRRKRKIEVTLSNGRSLNGDFLICCTGVEPRINFLAGTGISVEAGVIVDRRMRTDIANIYAAGDVTQSVGRFGGKPSLNAIAPSAITQGMIAGINMAGGSAEDRGWIPMNVFKFLGHSAVSVGLSHSQDNVTAYREMDRSTYRECVFRENLLVGARFIDVDVDPGVFRYLIEEEVPVKEKEKLIEKPREAAFLLMQQAESSSNA